MNVLRLLSQLLALIAISDVCSVAATPASAPPEQLSTQHIASTASSAPNNDAITKNHVTANPDQNNNQALKNAAEAAREKAKAKGFKQRLGTLRGQGAQDVADTAADARKAVAAAWGPLSEDGAVATTVTVEHVAVTQPTSVTSVNTQTNTEPTLKTSEASDDQALATNLRLPQSSSISEVEQKLQEAGITILTQTEAIEESTVGCTGNLLSCFGCVVSCGGEEPDEFRDYLIEELKKLIEQKEAEKQKAVEQLATAEAWKKAEETVKEAVETEKNAKKKFDEAMKLATTRSGAGQGTQVASKADQDKFQAARQAYLDQVKKVEKLNKAAESFRATAKRQEELAKKQEAKKQEPTKLEEPKPDRDGWLSRLSGKKSKSEATTDKTWLEKAKEAVTAAAARVKAADDDLKKMHKSLEKKGERKEKGAEALKLGEATKQAKAEVTAEIAQQKAETEEMLNRVKEEWGAKRAEIEKEQAKALKSLTVVGGGCTGSPWASAEEQKRVEDRRKAVMQKYRDELKKIDEAEKAAEAAVKAGEKSWEKVQERARQILEEQKTGAAKPTKDNANKAQPVPAATSTRPKATSVAATSQPARPSVAPAPSKDTPQTSITGQSVPPAPAPAKPAAAPQPANPVTYESLKQKADEAWKKGEELQAKLAAAKDTTERGKLTKEYQEAYWHANALTDKANRAEKAEKAKKAN